MPNKVTPTIEEANQLFKDKPHYKLKDWAKEWGVSIERVRQIKGQDPKKFSRGIRKVKDED